MGVVLEPVIIGNMLHNVLYITFENVAEFINGVHFDVFVVAQAIQLSVVDIVMRIQIVLRDTPLFHGLPQTIVFDQLLRHLLLDFLSLSP